MMEIEAVQIRRDGAEDDPLAKVVVSIQDIHGFWRDIIEEPVGGCFSHICSLPPKPQGGVT